MGEEWILTEHPDLKGGPVLRTMSSFVNLYEKKGWVAIQDPEKAKIESPREASTRVHKGIKKTAAKKAAAKK